MSLSIAAERATVIGLYGITGAGKTFLLNQLKQELDHEQFAFYDGSSMIAKVVPGGLDVFQQLTEIERMDFRKAAINTIRSECIESGRAGIVAGHFMFWPEKDEAGHSICTQNDLNTYTHIMYLDVPAEVVLERRSQDKAKPRPSVSISHIKKWQQAEKRQLRDLCRTHNILFLPLTQETAVLHNLSRLLHDFRLHNAEYNTSLIEKAADGTAFAGRDKLETMLVLDGDRTLAPVDTGTLFWQRAPKTCDSEVRCPLKSLFSGPLGYSYTAFRQATLLYEEVTEDVRFEAICNEVASMVPMYPEFISLLQSLAKEHHVGAVIITCGLRRVWEIVLEREGLSDTVKVIGGGRIADNLVVTAAVKTALVARFQSVHHLYVWVFGDSPLDIGMMSVADEAIVVVGEMETRSKTMETVLRDAIDNHSLYARQTILPSNALPRLDLSKLPVIQLQEQEFTDSVFRRRNRQAGIQLLHATNRTAAQLLMTATRDANTSGPALREAHSRVGQYLAIEFLSELRGVEEYRIPHVQGGYISGHRLLDEQKTVIVALMRGGEPMAFGVNDIFPLSMFIHAGRPDDIKLGHLKGYSTVVLVDSVVNNGTTIVQFERHIRKLHATIRIMVVAGVVQAQSIAEGSLIQGLPRSIRLDIVALRLSDNKFTGRGTTDTGNRLFNTTHLL